MSSPLEKFILENREKFDAEAPDSSVWEKISEKMNPEANKVIPLRSISFKRWLAAAAAVVLVGTAGLFFYSTRQHKPDQSVAGTNPGQSVPGNNLPVVLTPADSPVTIAKTKPVVPENSNLTTPAKDNETKASSDIGDNKEMYYYAKLIELKHEELKTLEKDEPLLYRQFAGDVQKLDSVYHSLKTKLPDNSNREQVIEAMISNLQLQIGLLNKQLDIIKQIKHSKKTAYEKAYKSV
jgi:hypothetical protein